MTNDSKHIPTRTVVAVFLVGGSILAYPITDALNSLLRGSEECMAMMGTCDFGPWGVQQTLMGALTWWGISLIPLFWPITLIPTILAALAYPRVFESLFKRGDVVRWTAWRWIVSNAAVSGVTSVLIGTLPMLWIGLFAAGKAYEKVAVLLSILLIGTILGAVTATFSDQPKLEIESSDDQGV